MIGAGLAVGFRAAFRGLSNHTELQLTGYRERLRLQARTEAISRIDSRALEHARRVAEPVLSLVASGQPPTPLIQQAAALADATLRDELLAPGFLTIDLADRVRAARITGARVTVDIAPQADAALIEAARRLLGTALAHLDVTSDARLNIYPPADGHPAQLIMHVRSQVSDHHELRELAFEHGALVSYLSDHGLLIRLKPEPAEAADLPQKGDYPRLP